jgi:hypothetical protein
MPHPERRRVTSPLLAVKTDEHGFATVSVGSIIETSDDLADPGLHALKVGDEELLAFTRDIEERTELLDQPSPTS